MGDIRECTVCSIPDLELLTHPIRGQRNRVRETLRWDRRQRDKTDKEQ